MNCSLLGTNLNLDSALLLPPWAARVDFLPS